MHRFGTLKQKILLKTPKCVLDISAQSADFSKVNMPLTVFYFLAKLKGFKGVNRLEMQENRAISAKLSAFCQVDRWGG